LRAIAVGIPCERLADVIGVRADEAGMVVEHAKPRNGGGVRPDRLLRVEEVLAVLPAAGVRAVRRCEKRECVPHAVVAHRGHRIGDERAPVAVAEVDRQVDAVRAQLRLERVDQRAVLVVDGADTAEELVMVRDVEQPLTRHAASARHVLQERHHVVGAFRTAERHDEDRVERRLGGRGAVGRRLADGDRRGH
jgi:hypothetical protein